MDHGARNAHQLLLPSRELVGKQILLGHDLEAIKDVGHHAGAVFGGHVLVGERQVDVFGNGEIVEQVIALEDHADALTREVGALLAVQLVRGRFAKPVLAQPAVVEQREHVEQATTSLPPMVP